MVARWISMLLFLVVMGSMMVVSGEEVAAEDEEIVVETPGEARIFFGRTLPMNAVQGDVINITYEIVNIGAGNAVDIKASDDLLLGKGFSLVDGSMVAEYKTLAPGSSETYSITVTCEKPGDIFVNPASLSYYATEKEDAAEQTVFSTVKHIITVESLESYKHRTDMHLDVLGIFTVAASLLTVAPLLGHMTAVSKLKKIGSTRKSQ